MACVTLKRTLDHADASPVPLSAKRRRFHGHCVAGRSPTSAANIQSLTFVPPPAAPCDGAAADAATVAAASVGDFPASRLPPELLSQRLAAEVKRFQRRRLVPSPTSPGRPQQPHQHQQQVRGKSPESDAEMSTSRAGVGCSGEPALFTLSQMQSITEKLLAEREQQLRAEFQALLSAKLQEQYDAFLRFNHDQIYRMHSSAPMSYVS